ncbi:efflux RND transporter permease subunit [Salinisphaera hydrothermalis]|uniref:efflux RND transporter permease subunit n=1 Tax=Salinisphaera hydrothermalis TaxID=563188 RepID=UPI0033422FED
MNISAPFIRNPIGTCLLAVGLLLLGTVSYLFLPVASLPSVDLPIITVSASLPGASPETVAATVAAPLERRLGAIPGVTALASTSTLGSTNIMVQFELSRSVDGAAQDVQAAINAAQADLPGNLPESPHLRKINPSAFPILILALTSKTMPPSDLYDVADTVIAQRIAQVEGVSDVSVTGAEQPAIRVDMHPGQLADMGVGLDVVRQAIINANVASPLGSFDGPNRMLGISSNDSLTSPEEYRRIPIKKNDGTIVSLSDVARVSTGTLDRLQTGTYDGKPAVLLIVHQSSGANVVATVERIKHMLPTLDRWIPSGVNITTFSDRTVTIHDSVNDLQFTLMASIALVMLVVMLFLRRGVPTIAAGVTVPLSLAGTAILMWLCGFSLDNLSLMALTISVGFVVDDAIVMIENVYRNLETGMRPLRAAFVGARQIGFTVVSISISLIAAFSPLVLMGGIAGRLLREFSLTLVFAIAVSAVVSLTVTPMICSRFIRRAPKSGETRLDRIMEPLFVRLNAAYTGSLKHVINQRWLMIGVTFLALVLMGGLFMHLPKSFIPQGDADLLIGMTQGAPDASFARMNAIEKRVRDIVLADPAVAHVGDAVGSSGRGGSNEARLFVALKPTDERTATAQQVIARLRPKLAQVKDARTFLSAIQALPTGVHHSDKGAYQFTLWSPDLPLLSDWTSKVLAKLRQMPQLADVSSDQDEGGPQVNVHIDRTVAARLHVSATAIDTALHDAFAQRQISTIHTQSNQYKVVLGVAPGMQRKIADISHIYVTADDGRQIPLSAVTTTSIGTAPLSVHHDGQFPSVTFSYNLAPGTAMGAAHDAIQQAMASLHPPSDIHIDLGDSSNPASAGHELLLIVAALVSVYLVLGILYESLIHPLTIISTLPSAGLGALLALYLTGTELSLMPVIGIVLLIGIVKKNGIMLVDFALEGERTRGWTPEKAIFEAARERFRPITMTTMAAVLGAVPLLIASGPGSELRRPLGITIIGGLIVSQLLTIYTTPAIYLVMDRMRWRRRRERQA